jgi:hypothetical protein
MVVQKLSEKVESTQFDVTAYDFEPMKHRLEEAALEHKTHDSWMFNGGTMLTIALTATASLVSSSVFGNDTAWLGAVFSALTGVMIAAERALAFGARWRFHHEMRSGYLQVVDMVDFACLLPSGRERDKYLKDIWTALYALRSRESAIPGSGTAPQ